MHRIYCSSSLIKSFHSKLINSYLGHYSSTYAAEYQKSIENPEEFWQSKTNLIEWYKKPEKTLERNEPFDRWYVGGQVNASFNCIDQHVLTGFANQTAIIHDSPLTSSTEKITYKQLQDEVSLFAGVLAKYGIKKGDRVLIYMPMIPQAIVTMLASARIGAIHSLVFGGFASKELATRINHAKPKIIVSANVGVEPNRLINYKNLLDHAIELAEHKPLKCIFYNRKMFPEAESNLNKHLYLDYSSEISKVKPHICIPIDSNDPLYVLYTSGTTGLPKGVVRLTAGYLIALKYSMQAIMGLKPGETWSAFSDLGWVVGHSFICYGPLLNRNTTVIYEGKPVGTPDSGAVFRVISEHKVNAMFIAPTALRAIHQQDPDASLGKKYPIDNLKRIFVAGEHCDHETLKWIQNVIKGKPVYDHWWQTESGWPMTSKCAGIMNERELKLGENGNSGMPVPGWNVKILREDKTEAGPNELGRIVCKLPLPPGSLGTLWQNDTLFKDTYFKEYPGYYDTADVGIKCENNCITVLSRADDVINVAGHRLSSSAIEEAILEHDECVECAVVEVKDTIKGSIPFAFIVRLNTSQTNEKILIEQVISLVRKSIGPVASFKKAVIVKRLPKTRSGKIPRQTLQKLINNQPFTIPVTIEDENVYEEIKAVIKSNSL